MKLPFGLNKLLEEKEKSTMAKKSTVIAEEAKIEETPVRPAPPKVGYESPDPDDEFFDTLQSILENQFMARDEVSAIRNNSENILAMLSTLVKLWSSGSVSSQSGASSEEVTDYKTVIVTQRTIIRTILTIPVLDAATREAISKALVEMPEWEILEAAENRLKERDTNRKTLNELQNNQV